MKVENNFKKKISIELDLTDYIDKFGKKYSITEEQIGNVISLIQPNINSIISKNKQEYLLQNRIYDFESFKIDPIILRNYIEDDIEKYKHFVWELYSKYIINFKRDSEKHLELIRCLEKNSSFYEREAKIAKQKLKKLDKDFKNGKIAKIAKKKKEESGETFDLSLLIKHEYETQKHKILEFVSPPTTVKVKVLQFLAFSQYLHKFSQDYQKYQLNVNKKNFKEFVDFILDSNMVSLNEAVYKNNFLENSEIIHNFTVGAALIFLCVQLDFKEGFYYLKAKGLCEECIDTDNFYNSFIYILIKSIEDVSRNDWREWDYILKNNLTQNVKNVFADDSNSVNVDVLNNLINKLKWINTVTTEFPKLKLNCIEENGSVIEQDGRRYWSSSRVTNKKFKIIPKYINNIIRNNQFSDIVYSLFSDKFIKNNTHTLNDEINLVKQVYDYFNNKKEEKTLCKLYKIYDNTINCNIQKIQSGGYIEKNDIKKDYEYTLKVKEVYFSDNEYDNILRVYFYNNINQGYSNSSYVLENKFEISKFTENKEELIFLIEKWFLGLEIKNKKIEDFVDPKRKNVLEEIMKKEQEICELKKTIGEGC